MSAEVLDIEQPAWCDLVEVKPKSRLFSVSFSSLPVDPAPLEVIVAHASGWQWAALC